MVQCEQFKSENICLCKQRRTRGVLYCLTHLNLLYHTHTHSHTHTHVCVCAAGPVWLASDAHKHSAQCHKQCEVSVVEGVFRSFSKVKIQIHSGSGVQLHYWNITVTCTTTGATKMQMKCLDNNSTQYSIRIFKSN